MGISDILSEDMILINLEAENKRQVLEQISSFIAQKENLDKNTIFDAVLERENLGSTGYGNGVSFPHARINGLNQIVTAFARVTKSVDYNAVDEKPVDLVAFLISPEKSGEDHLQALAIYSRVLKNEDVCLKIREAKSAHEIFVALNK
jgi:nitrogen PTS system EIIA component